MDTLEYKANLGQMETTIVGDKDVDFFLDAGWRIMEILFSNNIRKWVLARDKKDCYNE